MPKSYNIGSKADAVINMAGCAIRDQRALIEAMTPRSGKADPETQENIDICKKWIADFKRIQKLYE